MSEHRAVALEALGHYDIVPQRVRLAAESFNSIFRVTTASAVYALRVGALLQIHPEGTAAVEAAWHRRCAGTVCSFPMCWLTPTVSSRRWWPMTEPSMGPGCA